jgi:hypothetical protein
MNTRVAVTVNGKADTFFLGLAVRHAIGNEAAREIAAGRAEVRTGDGNLVGLDGALFDGEVLVVTPVKSVVAATPARRRRKKST